MIVLDASACLEFLIGTPRGVAVEARIRRSGYRIHVPGLLDLEVAQVLRKLLSRGRISAARADLALRNHRDLRLRRHDHLALLPRIWALRDNLSAYDAAYVALAEALEVPLVTGDRQLAGASGHRARVEVI